MSPGFLGTVYRMIQESFINMENMFSLMEEEVEVTDQPNALREIINYSFKSVFYKGRRKKKKNLLVPDIFEKFEYQF